MSSIKKLAIVMIVSTTIFGFHSSHVEGKAIKITAGVTEKNINSLLNNYKGAGVSYKLIELATNNDLYIECNDVDICLYQKGITRYYVNSAGLNIRKEKDKKSGIIGVYKWADEVLVSEYIEKDWCKVIYDDKYGYVYSEFLSKTKPTKNPYKNYYRNSNTTTNSSSLLKVSSTAYYDKYYTNSSASGVRLYYGCLAGKVSWLGRSCELYSCNSDGSVGNKIGDFVFRDTGYGQSTGYGSSRILRGKSIGTIENGTCIDVFFNTYAECIRYGRKNVYIKWK